MKRLNNIDISLQVINTMQQSDEPWGIKDQNSCWIYGNQAMRSAQNLQNSFDYEGRYDDEIPWDGAEFAKEFIIHDKSVMEKGERICSLETHMYGKDKFLSSLFSEKYPLYNDENECVGIFLHGWPAQDFSLTRLFHGKLPASIMFQPPTDLFTQREWDVIFLSLQKYTSKQMGKILNISYRTVEVHMSRIYKKVGVNSSYKLEEYCRTNDFDLYVPERFVHPESRVFSSN
ncbi:helix-turn-helix transcriptional regulator [Photorhabdus heterorhabditis]|uniref:Helix-turn-helix transcriptional regulator n=1 Tax=Photorhabdus heterorhabditis TaxID=880156 RepID=A0A5B0VLN9_9GAMM|nr:PAS and helix-turn-helix domain-containing protein [Photorhabdus heterorhabditis]KAA1175557.1 helix-turn-helix transcriptional regulator [Photorhabdus heterorhabditis]KOY60206.1 LuxR family transcriptional regulator [Photorhabdus heterorhabditis]MBS9444235.1 helix-turn-helix transcriptional regulator [Photorhabdus heterorhabditis]